MAFPHGQHAPTVGLQRGCMLSVSNPCSCELWLPIPEIGLRQTRNRAIWVRMPMPETTVDKDYRSVAREDQVGLSRHEKTTVDKDYRSVAREDQVGLSRHLNDAMRAACQSENGADRSMAVQAASSSAYKQFQAVRHNRRSGNEPVLGHARSDRSFAACRSPVNRRQASACPICDKSGLARVSFLEGQSCRADAVENGIRGGAPLNVQAIPASCPGNESWTCTRTDLSGSDCEPCQVIPIWINRWRGQLPRAAAVLVPRSATHPAAQRRRDGSMQPSTSEKHLVQTVRRH